MTIQSTPLAGCLIVEPKVFADDRGHFFESFNQREFGAKTGLVDVAFVQDNQSLSKKNVVRGLHYQPLKPQGKLVRVLSGAVWDVAVDLRRSSPTFGRWFGLELSAHNRLQLWLPPGFAHGFSVLSDSAEVLYKTTDYYAPSDERAIVWNDPTLAIDWRLSGSAIVSAKDAAALKFLDAPYYEARPQGGAR